MCSILTVYEGLLMASNRTPNHPSTQAMQPTMSTHIALTS
jgi:hypothetical protein